MQGKQRWTKQAPKKKIVESRTIVDSNAAWCLVSFKNIENMEPIRYMVPTFVQFKQNFQCFAAFFRYLDDSHEISISRIFWPCRKNCSSWLLYFYSLFVYIILNWICLILYGVYLLLSILLYLYLEWLNSFEIKDKILGFYSCIISRLSTVR